jgi:hypothetical protein
MNKFEEWWEQYDGCVTDSMQSFEATIAIASFKAGMLAAAEIVDVDFVTEDYEAGKNAAASIIREEVGDL